MSERNDKPQASGADIIFGLLPDLRERIEARLVAYARERNWEKLREYEMANIAAEEAAVSMVELVAAMRAASG